MLLLVLIARPLLLLLLLLVQAGSSWPVTSAPQRALW
jgi:hypothetical protein